MAFTFPHPHASRLALAAGLAVCAPLAQAAVLDFEDMVCARSQPICNVGEVYRAKGYVLSYAPAPDDEHPIGFHVVGRQWAPNVGGSIAMLANSCNAITTLASQAGKPFSVLTMDLAEANADSPSRVTFTGLKTDGTTVRLAVNLDGRPGWQRIVLPGTFYNLISLQWVQGDCVDNKSHMFDNILVMPGISTR